MPTEQEIQEIKRIQISKKKLAKRKERIYNQKLKQTKLK